MIDILKKILPIFLVLGISFSATAQIVIPAEIVKGFSKGDSELLSKYFEEKIELSINKKENIYSKTQAKQIMSKFFKLNTPSLFTKKHIGGKNNSHYVVANLKTKTGIYNVNFLLKKNTKGKLKMQRLRIEKAK
jgi:hypothetical protein